MQWLASNHFVALWLRAMFDEVVSPRGTKGREARDACTLRTSFVASCPRVRLLPTATALDVARALPGVAKAETAPVLATALIAPPKPVVQPPAAAAPQPAKLVMTALVPSAPVAAPVPAQKADVSAVVRTDDAHARRDAVRAAYEGRYLMVLGSFKGPEMAGRLAKLHAGATVVKVDVHGETYYRVVIEPEKGARFAAKMSDKPWLMPAAGVQVASLQGTLR